MPAIAGAAAADDEFTKLLTSATGTDATTRLLPSGAPVGAAAVGTGTAALDTDAAATQDAEEKKKKRSPWTWPLIALIALLALVLIGTLVALLNTPDDSADPVESPTRTAPTQAAPSTPSDPEPSTPAAPTTGDPGALDLEGRSCDEATRILNDEGFANVVCERGDAAPSEDQTGQVYRVNPTGNVDFSDRVTLTFWDDVADMADPGAPRIEGGNGDGTVTAGSTVNVMWDSYTCPAGSPTVSTYTMTLSGGVFETNGETTANFGIDDRPAGIVVDESGVLAVTYTVTCDGENGDRTSGSSPEASASVVPAQTPAPEETEGADG